MVVYLIRHGAYELSADRQGRVLTPTPKTGLSPSGKEQMITLAEKIRKHGDTIDVLYASPYVRTRESATILRDAFGARLVIDNELRDVYTPGWWNVPVEELKAVGGDVYSIAPRSDDQETYGTMTDRFFRAFYSIVAKENGHMVGLVFHGDPIRVLLYRLDHPAIAIPPMRMLSESDYLDKGEAWRLVIENGLTVKEKEHVGSSEEQFNRGERKY